MRREYIYLMLFAAVTIPMLVPLGLPVKTGHQVASAWQLLEDLQPGDIVHFTFEFEAVGIPELGPMVDVMLPYLASKDVKIVAVSFTQQGPIFSEQYLEKHMPEAGYVYGEDYINLGYVPGRIPSAVAYAEDVWNTVGKDFKGVSLSEYPIMEEVHDIHDYALLIHIASDPADGVGSVAFCTNVAVPNNMKMLLGIHTLAVALNMPYLQARQLTAMIPGLRGAAELETIAGEKGIGIASMDAQSLAHLVILGLVAAGNIAYFRGKHRKGGASR